VDEELRPERRRLLPPDPSPLFPVEPSATSRPDGRVDEATYRSFLRMMSHELRTPLNSIIGFADILSSELYGPLGAPQYKEFSDIIGVSGQRLLSLVNNALEIIRLESGSAELEIGSTPFCAAVDDACQMVEAEAAARGIRIAFEPPVPAVQVMADRRALRTVAGNLIQNAVTWSPDGGIVRASIQVDGPVARLTISDEGAGVDPVDLPRLMRPFEQGEYALTRRGQGTGLGWPLVRLLTQAMGGQFRVETVPGEGLTAVVQLRRLG